ncbi:hypothetical protein [Roseixanthobacter liquoris]|uniref:hypothetical protein n=1 Tax=Roseixanthobacter liquoris TaxID=3119921 RepID=UPI0037273428
MDGTERDPTKTIWYVTLDLFIKSVSALGVVILGFVGFRLQSDGQLHDQERRLSEVRSGIYLPALQVLAQLQVAFSVLAPELKFTGNHSHEDDSNKNWKLQFLIGSLQYPQDISDSIKIARLAEYKDGRSAAGTEPVSYKAAARMAGEFWGNISLFRKICEPTDRFSENLRVRVQSNPPALHFFLTLDLQALPGDETIPLDPESFSAWNGWISPTGVTMPQFCRTNFEQLFKDLANGALTVSDRVLDRYPILSEKSVTMRTDALKASDALWK